MKTYKVAYNASYGGFGLSKKAQMLGILLSGKEDWNGDRVPRHDPILIDVIEELGDRASGPFSNIKIAVIDSNKYYIDEYDGVENVMTPEMIDWISIEE